MNLEDLRAVQVDERATDSVQSLPDSFYRDVAAYVDDLRDQRAQAAERADDPFDSEKARRLTDEVETAEEVVEAIYERRVGKVVKRASLAAAGMPADDEGLTDEERTLFNRLVDEIEANRQQVLTVFEGSSGDDDLGEPDRERPGGSAREADTAGDDEPPLTRGGPDSAEGRTGESVSGGAGEDATGEPADRGGENPTQEIGGEELDRVTLRITQDVGEVFGVDERVYQLGEEDVVTLPEPNAGPLLDRDAAERLE